MALSNVSRLFYDLVSDPIYEIDWATDYDYVCVIGRDAAETSILEALGPVADVLVELWRLSWEQPESVANALNALPENIRKTLDELIAQEADT